ncbi:MAG: UDP-glucose--hexose-1-phosphate uridylyltransferase, partial [Enterococcus sp.]|nr:UDP-glucose--hexose-1-phosphate uridylyltransferase [Enterococcus sp.]
MTIIQVIVDFTTAAIQAGGWMEMDRLYVQNRILALIGEDSLDEEASVLPLTTLPINLMDQLITRAQENQVIADTQAEIEILEAELMDFLTPPPSVVNAFFAQHYEKSPQQATDYFFELCQRNDYIKTRAIAKNIVFPIETQYGALDITINLSKPEKDPKEIAAQKNLASVNYPK